jgi:amino acid transporter
LGRILRQLRKARTSVLVSWLRAILGKGVWVYSLAALLAAIPVGGAGYGFARRARGLWGGFLTGTPISLGG